MDKRFLNYMVSDDTIQMKKIDGCIDVLKTMSLNATDERRMAAADNLNAILREIGQEDSTFYRYVSGRGSIALKIQEQMAINFMLAGHTVEELEDCIQRKLGMFNLNPLCGVASRDEMAQFLETLRPIVMGENFMVQPTEIAPDNMTLADAVTGIYADPRPGFQTRRQIYLATQLPQNPEVRIILTASANATVRIWVRHPFENVWLVHDNSCVLPFMVKALKEELDKVMKSFEPVEHSTEWKTELDMLSEKASFIFDNEARLPAKFRQFERASQYSAKIECPVLKYKAVFLETKSTYSSRGMIILQTIGNIDQSVKFADLSEIMKRQFIQRVSDQLDWLVDYLKSTGATSQPEVEEQV